MFVTTMKVSFLFMLTIPLVISHFDDQSIHRQIFGSKGNAAIARREYPFSPLELLVAILLGDEIPQMRDELIRRKNEEGEDIVTRHIKAWRVCENWLPTDKTRKAPIRMVKRIKLRIISEICHEVRKVI